MSNDTSTEIVNVMTGALSSAEITHTRFDVFLCGLSACKVRPGIQWSDDGVTWDPAVGINMATAPNQYATAAGWTYTTTYSDIFALGSPKLFIRFVILALNTSGSDTGGVQCRLKVRVKPVRARTIVIGPLRVHNKGVDTTTWLTFVASGPIPANKIASLRGTLELQSTTSQLEAKLAFQTSNEPNVATSWGNDTDIAGTTRSTEGTSYGTTFASVSTSQDQLRIIIKVRNTATPVIEAARILARLDFRAS